MLSLPRPISFGPFMDDPKLLKPSLVIWQSLAALTSHAISPLSAWHNVLQELVLSSLKFHCRLLMPSPSSASSSKNILIGRPSCIFIREPLYDPTLFSQKWRGGTISQLFFTSLNPCVYVSNPPPDVYLMLQQCSFLGSHEACLSRNEMKSIKCRFPRGVPLGFRDTIDA